jgi:hypothetical protein
MLATPERIRGQGATPDTTIWHKPVGDCKGDCDFHPIACSDDEGIVLPGGTRNVPLNLDEPGERWCPACLALARA